MKMKRLHNPGQGYSAPSVEKLDISVEKGFAVSGNLFNTPELEWGGEGIDQFS